MPVRKANPQDAPQLRALRTLLPMSSAELEARLEKQAGSTDHEVFVYEQDSRIRGYISVYYLTRLQLQGEVAFIIELEVGKARNGLHIGQELEAYAAASARDRKCDHIRALWHSPYRDEANFYENQGYITFPKYFTKRLSQKHK